MLKPGTLVQIKAGCEHFGPLRDGSDGCLYRVTGEGHSGGSNSVFIAHACAVPHNSYHYPSARGVYGWVMRHVDLVLVWSAD